MNTDIFSTRKWKNFVRKCSKWVLPAKPLISKISKIEIKFNALDGVMDLWYMNLDIQR
jgi:hypothetical protein